jgi:hypothetical protein
MAGIIEIAHDRIWHAANWVYRGIIGEVVIALRLKPGQQELIATLTETIDSNLLLLSCETEMTNQMFLAFREALHSVLGETLKRGSSAFAEPQSFDPYVSHLKELIRLADEKAISGPAKLPGPQTRDTNAPR